MSEPDRLATAQWVLERTLDWIAAAEVKAGVIITIDVAMLGGLAAAYSAVSTKTQAIYCSSAAAAIFTIIALACAAMSVKPRLDGPKRSLLYFGCVAQTPRADYMERFQKVTDDVLLVDWTEQIHRNAEIAKTKHEWVNLAVAWSFLGAIAWFIAVALLVRS